MSELTTVEQSRLIQCEAEIEEAKTAFFYKAGRALREIHDGKLYRITHATFEDYCRERWGFNRDRAYKLIEAAQVVENVSHGIQATPTNERQARELVSLEPEQQREVWQEAVKTAPNGHVTASHIREVRQAYTTPAIEQPRRLEPPPHHRLSSDDPRRYTIVPYPSPASIPHVAHNSGNNEWYTPAEYIEAARKVMGTIDLDPASSEVANRIVKAKKFYTVQDDGLSKDWRGRVWMNPPYAGELIGQFVAKLCNHFNDGEVTEAIVLVNNATETGWFQNMMPLASAICFPRGRVKFWHPSKESAPLQGQAALYLGKQQEKFRREFSDFGSVVFVCRS